MWRLLTIPAALVLAATLAAPAQADHASDDSGYTFTDPGRDAAARADVTGGAVHHGGTNGFTLSVSTRVRDVRGSGRYESYLEIDPRPDHGLVYVIATVVKDPGRAPRTTVVWRRADSTQWQRVQSCPVGTTWDTVRDFVSARVHLWECGFVEGSSTLMKVRYTSGGATDVSAGTGRFAEFYRVLGDATGDAAPGADIELFRHRKTADQLGFTADLRDLRDSGRLVVETGDDFHTRYVVQKAAGERPVATVARGGPNSWSGTQCRPAVNWDPVADRIVVVVKRVDSACATVWEADSHLRLYYAFMAANGTTDVVRP